MIIGVTGLLEDSEGNRRSAGAGKDSVCDILLVHRHVVKIALADPLKRICRDVYGFSYEQLWGPSEKRNEPDPRYMRMKAGALGSTGLHCKDPEELNGTVWEKYKHLLNEHGDLPAPPVDKYLTPRYALQTLGTEWGRDCYNNTWVDFGFAIADKLMSGNTWAYSDYWGLVDKTLYYADEELDEDDVDAIEEALLSPPAKYDVVAHAPDVVKDVAFSDMRFHNEFDAGDAREDTKIIRVKRKIEGSFFDSDDYHMHESERGIVEYEDDRFAYVIDNYGSAHDLTLQVLRAYDVLTGRIQDFDESQENVPPFLRKKQEPAR